MCLHIMRLHVFHPPLTAFIAKIYSGKTRTLDPVAKSHEAKAHWPPDQPWRLGGYPMTSGTS